MLTCGELATFLPFVTDVALLLVETLFWTKIGNNMIHYYNKIAIVSWRNSVNFKSKMSNASPSRKVWLKRYWLGTVVVLFPGNPWSIKSFARRTSIRFFGWSKMRIFCLTQVESSLVGSVWTDSLRMLPSSSDKGSSFTITSSRLIVTFTFLDFVQSQSICGVCLICCVSWRFKSTCWFVGKRL